MAVNLHNWITNLAPAERLLPQITSHPVSTWIGGPPGRQPQSVGNPAGQMPPIPIMALTPEAWEALAGAGLTSQPGVH